MEKVAKEQRILSLKNKYLSLITMLLFFSANIFAQSTPYPNNGTGISNDSTLYFIKGGTRFKDGFIVTVYTDTASANLKHINYYNGFLIKVGSDLYYRDSISTNRAYWRWAKVGANGASTVTISSDSTALYICNNTACDTFNFSTIAPIQNFTIVNDSTIVICGISSCDTLHTAPTDYNTLFVTSASIGVGNAANYDSLFYFKNGVKYFGGFIGHKINTILPLFTTFNSDSTIQYLQIQQPDGIIGSCPVIWDSLLVFSTPPCNAIIGGKFYSSPANTMTLTPADSTFPTQYLFVFDSTGITTFIRGTPSASPTVPQYDPASQLPLTSGIVIAANATTPSNVVDSLIYDEGVGVPTEATYSTSGTLTANDLDVANPYHGLKDIFVSKYNNGSKLIFLSSTEKMVSDGQILNGYIYFNGVFTNKFRYQFYDGTTAVSNSLTVYNNYGLNPSNSSVYQHLAIPLSAFSWTGTQFNKLVITHVGNDNSGTAGYFMDYFSLQNGVTPTPPVINKVDSTTTLKLNDSTYLSLYWINGVSYQKGDTIKIHSTGGGGGGTGTVTSISQGYGIANTPNPITSTGTVAVDSAALSLKYVRIADTSAMLSPYAKNIAVALKLNISDTASMLSPYAKNNALALKVNISDTASMLSHYLNDVGYGLTKSGQIVILDSSKYATATNSGILQNTDWSKFTNKTDSVSLNAGGDSLIVIKNSNRYAYKLPASGGTGTVTSVAMTMPGTLFNSSVTGSPITTTGTFTPTLATQSAYTVLGNHTSGSATPTFGKLPINSLNTTGTPSSGTFLRGDGAWTTGNLSPWTYNGSDIYFNTGNVGIGTSSPTVKLDIETDTTSTQGFLLADTTAATSSMVANSPAIYLSANSWNAGSVNKKMKIFNAGNTSAPNSTFTIQQNTNGGAYSNLLVLNSYGGLTIYGNQPSSFYALTITSTISANGTISNPYAPYNACSGCTFRAFDQNPNLNVPSGTSTDIGFSYRPTLTNLTGITDLVGFTNTYGNNYFNTSGYGTAIGASSIPSNTIFKVASTTQTSHPFPNMTSAQRTAISSPNVGDHVYQTDGTEGVYVYKSTGWTFAY